MSSNPIPWKHVRNILVLFAPLWGGAAILFGCVGLVYALFSSDYYTARQPLVVRDEATSSLDRLGRFASQTDLKAAQETILEMTRNPEVVAEALRRIGPPGGGTDPTWPTTDDIDTIATKFVNLVAPKGSEFGNTEVVYLSVKAKSQERADAFCNAMYISLTDQLRKVRRVRADSVIGELSHARDLAARNLNHVAAKLREIEIEFGTDLGDLRNLNDTISGDGTNRRTLEETTRELQAAELEMQKLESLHSLLVAGADDPQRLLISGSELLDSQPSLSRLKDGLIDAQLAASQMAGIYTESNPKLRAAMQTELEIRDRMQQETKAAIAANEPRLALQRNRVATLAERAKMLNNRLGHLAVIRTDYSKLDADVKHRTEMLAEAERSLAEASATRSAALSTNLISPLGPPQVSDHPNGPGGSIIALGSTMAGLIFGLGTVFMIAPGPTEARGGRRWSDYLGAGRRSSDDTAAAGKANRRSADNAIAAEQPRAVPPAKS
ncbi:hypothetical protein N9N28_02250 [Rubripirellula amarantea]|uniref:Uncharacterized protein n=1 Tax=Rubripirellula amarantea TaxID=2527999 RepID=A0A5C5WM76_9BACT|nr:hypothetical protein [Rubripirellula amarantea]MDA8743431.1 hypothetical protein [Rubripirellula amarantea]TWT51275.1 hypothetical protein Pla22_40520 [Rubripirellula amarantea]